VFSVDGQQVGDRADCTAAIPISAGTRTITTSLAGDRIPQEVPVGPRDFFRSIVTLTFDAEEGHHYRISMDGVYIDLNRFRARVWVEDATTQTRVTEARLVTSPPQE
jgi:hypothetical protein